MFGRDFLCFSFVFLFFHSSPFSSLFLNFAKFSEKKKERKGKKKSLFFQLVLIFFLFPGILI